MIEQYLILAGSAIVVFLGIAHLLGTFFSDMFLPEDQDLLQKMKTSTKKDLGGQNLLNAYIGFNASHSSGAIFFGLINIILAFNYFEIFEKSYAIHFLNLSCLFFLAFVAKKYWFKIPFGGLVLVTSLFLISTIMIFAQ